MPTYNLRRRAMASTTGESPIPANDGASKSPKITNRNTSGNTVTRTWSDVVAERSPSPSERVYTDVPVALAPGIANNVVPISSSASSDSELDNNPNEEQTGNPNPWITVTSRRSRSLDSSYNRKKKNFKRDPLVKAAIRKLTPSQKEHLNKRYKNIQSQRESSPESRGEGPSKDKGKVTDPSNWGAAGLDAEETAFDLQKRLYEEYMIKKRTEGPKKTLEQPKAMKIIEPEKNKPAPMSSLAEQHIKKIIGKQGTTHSQQREVESDSQEDSDAYMARAMKESRQALRQHRNSPTNSSEASFSYSEPSEPSSPSSSSSDSEEEMSRKPRHRHQSRRSRRKNSRKPRRTTIQPIPPKEYDGVADARSYNRFVTEATAYVQDGHVKSNRQVFILSYYLKGKAYDFYVQRVSVDPHQWTLSEFLRELFNYCFPINYRLKQREKLRKSFQNDKSVLEYTYELEELFTMIGISDERERVMKLWLGLRTNIQKSLWREHLNPDISTWKEVSEAAQIIEIAEGVTDHRDRNQPKKQSGSDENQRPRNNRPHQNQPFRRGSQAPPSNRHRDHRVPSTNHPARRMAPQQGQSGPSRTQLTDKERNDLLASGKCFKCKEAGHLARNCPSATFVKSSHIGKAPGVPNYGIGIDLQRAEEAQSLAETTENLYDIDLNAIAFEVNEQSDSHSQSVPRRLGDCAAKIAVQQLHAAQPYPGDSWYLTQDKVRFHVELRTSYLYLIMDSEYEDEDIYVSIDDLHNPEFNLPLWYATTRANILNLDFEGLPLNNWLDHPMGDVLAQGLTQALNDSILEIPEARFRTPKGLRFTINERTDYAYQIIDYGEHLITRIRTSLVRNPKLQIAEWYSKRVRLNRKERRMDHIEPFLTPHDPSPIGDLLGRAAAVTLERGCPYPGDPIYEDMGESRFRVTKVSEQSHLIEDSLLRRDKLITTAELINPSFQITHWYAHQSHSTKRRWRVPKRLGKLRITDAISDEVKKLLNEGQPYPGDDQEPHHEEDERFEVVPVEGTGKLAILDLHRNIRHDVALAKLQVDSFDVINWYSNKIKEVPDHSIDETDLPNSDYYFHSLENPEEHPELAEAITQILDRLGLRPRSVWTDELAAMGVQIPQGTLAAIERNAATPRDFSRVVPKPLVVVTQINGHPVRALIDSGSLGDFMSTTLADQLKVNKIILAKPLPLQLAVSGSRSKVNYGTKVKFHYQQINEERYFDIINISNYDLILGTPWIYQHQVTLGMNPASVVIGSNNSLPIRGDAVTRIASRALEIADDELNQIRRMLEDYALPICQEAADTALPPLRAINHTIPLIDETAIYPWHPSRCPEAMRSQWAAKREAYIRSGRWEVTSAGNTVPMLLIPKPRKPGEPHQLRTVIDLRARNKNTVKLSSPLPDMDAILRRAASHRYRSLLDGKDAYEQIRVVPEHVPRTTVTTPDGNMVSHVIQIGDCNAPATYQALMNHIFSAHIGVWMDVYLDDIVIYSNTLEEHVEHVKTVINILRNEKLYLSRNKLHFLCKEVKILGRVIDDNGIRMDPSKIDSVLAWKTPTNRDLLRGFLGAVGYLADDLARVRVPMGVLTALTGDTVPFQWGPTQQRAFEEVKTIVATGRGHSRVPLNYSPGHDPIFLVTDGCATGISGLVSQGTTWKTARVAVFYSAKLNSAQQNYPVHEIEMLAGIETMLRHRDILQGIRFQWITDHKGLIHLLNQKNLSGRQARWMEKIGEFDFEVVYIPGSENVLADALSRIYSNEAPGTVRSAVEYTDHDEDNAHLGVHEITMPLLVGAEAKARRMPRLRRELPGAETGRPETSREFAARVKSHFVLRGPKERKEGEVRGKLTRPRNKKANYPLDSVENHAKASERHNSRSVHENSTTVTSGGNAELPPLEPVPEDTTDQAIVPVAVQPDTLLVEVVSGGRDGIDLIKTIRNQYQDDPFFRIIMQKPKEYKNFEITKDGLTYVIINGRRLLCIPKVITKGRNIREIIISEAHSLLAHLGASKTIDYLRDQVWWKDMVSDTRAFCETCQTCKRSKPSNQKPYGLLNPLPIPSQPWEAIGVDFVGPLPESSNRDGTFDSITVVIDLLTAMVHLVPSRINYNTRQVAELMFESIYKLHGLPKTIISDRDVLFTSVFWQHLHRLVGTQLKMSSAYHPETDGSTERANRTITQMLRQCIGPNQKDWVSKLPFIEFAINSARSESTGYAPFYLNGRMPRPMIWDSARDNEYPGVRNFALQRKLALIQAHDCIIAARVKQTRDANRKRRPCPFGINDLVYLSTKNISFPKGFARKLVPKYIGPYKITHDFGNQSFRIDLPSHLKQRGVHDVFHASLLRIHTPNDDRLFPGRLDTQLGNQDDSDGEWAVDSVTAHSGAHENALFQVKWRSGDITWMPYYQISHLDALANYLDLMGVKNISELPIGTAVSPDEDFSGTDHPRPLPETYKRSLNQTPTRQPSTPSPPINSLSISSIAFDMAPAPNIPIIFVNHQHFSRINREEFSLFDHVAGVNYAYQATTIRDFIKYDKRLRHIATTQNRAPGTGYIPGGYDEFARIFNHSDANCTIRFARAENTVNDLIVTTGPSMPDFALDQNEIYPPAVVVPQGGMILDSNQASVTNNMLWDVAFHTQRHKAFNSTKKAERLARKAAGRPYSANGRSPVPGTSNAHQSLNHISLPTAHAFPLSPADSTILLDTDFPIPDDFNLTDASVSNAGTAEEMVVAATTVE